MEDSNLSFFDSLASRLIIPYFFCPQVAASDDEFGFDPLPSMISLAEYAFPGKMYDGVHTRSKSDTLEEGLVQEGAKLTDSNKSSPNKRPAGSCSEIFKATRSNKNVSSHVVRHGQVTPRPIKASLSNDAPKDVKSSAPNSASKKSHGLQLAVSAASTSLVSLSSISNVESVPKSSQRTAKPTKRLRTPVRLLNDRERKLSLEKNKMAAANCRVKKQKRENGLQAQSRELVSNNAVLKQSVSDMTHHLQELRCMLQFHVLSAGCYAPSHVQEALGEQSSHDSFSQTSLCDDTGSISTGELPQTSSTESTYNLPDMVADDWCMSDVPPIGGLSPTWESLLPLLDLTDGLETTITEPVRSEVAMPLTASESLAQEV